MYKELRLAEGLSKKEAMYVIASEWIDEICIAAVENAEEFMENDFCRNVVYQAAEHILRYRKARKEIILEKKQRSIWTEWEERDLQSYKMIMYDCYFKKFGANSNRIA